MPGSSQIISGNAITTESVLWKMKKGWLENMKTKLKPILLCKVFSTNGIGEKVNCTTPLNRISLYIGIYWIFLCARNSMGSLLTRHPHKKPRNWENGKGVLLGPGWRSVMVQVRSSRWGNWWRGRGTPVIYRYNHWLECSSYQRSSLCILCYTKAAIFTENNTSTLRIL